MAVATTRLAVNLGIHCKNWARVAPIATLLKIAGKMVPQRQPRAKLRLVTSALMNANAIKNPGANCNEE